ncbi:MULTISPECIES: hypothetical protein [Chitinibacter]|jgi:hypothetical protein|uniref:hypothetical protein n=1 Tax=Chitinibacter TaxID=230666 RepID=UPI00041A5D07|nr:MULTISPECIES: hypothetical protein [Chitinibacter]
MASSYRLQIGLSPLAPQEADIALGAIRRTWCMPSWVRKQPLADGVILLEVRHEAELKPGESADWFVERLAAALWQDIGRFVRIAIDIAPHEAPDGRIFVLEEESYWRIMRSFRLSQH